MVTAFKLIMIAATVYVVAVILDSHIPGAAKVLFSVFGVGITGTFLAGLGTAGIGAKILF